MNFLLNLVAGRDIARGLAETLKVLTAIAAVLGALWWLRSDAARDARAAAEAAFKTEIKRLEDDQRQKAEAASVAAETAGANVAPVPADDARLRRLCDGDPACRDRD